VKWCRGIGYTIVRGKFHSSPNGWTVRNASPKERAIQGMKLKAQGTRNGWPDLEFSSSRTIAGTKVAMMLFMEVKLGTVGVLSPAQVEVHDMLRGDGHFVVVARNLTDAIKIITQFYAIQ
jgi:hypothetical protein